MDHHTSAFDKVKRFIIVTNTLPVEMTKNENGLWEVEFDTTSTFEEGLLYTALSNCLPNALFVGVPPINVKLSERDQLEAALLEKRCYPVFCGKKEASYHFQGVCKSVLWPLFHNVIDLYNEMEINMGSGLYINRPGTPGSEQDGGEWAQAQSFNPQEIETLWPMHLDMMVRFRGVVKSLYSEGDVIWIHDYHLCMLISPLRRQLPLQAPIGIFLHAPWPSSDIFRCLSKREDMLKSLLQANHIGFHSFTSSRSFLTACNRLVGCVYGPQPNGVFGIRTGKGRTVTMTTSHAGIDPVLTKRMLHLIPALPPLFSKPEGGALVICGIDEVEGLRGLALKLLAFDRLLMLVPKFQTSAHRVVLHQVGIQLNARPHDFAKCLQEINHLVDQINAKYGADTVQFRLLSQLSLKDRLRFYSDSDVLLQSCVKWGLSVDGFEWVMAQRVRADEAVMDSRKRGPGVIVISEFVSSCRILNGAIRINPWSVEDTAKALEEACKMPLEERIARTYRDANMIDSWNCKQWAHVVLNDLAACSFNRELQSKNLLSYGFGLAMRSLGKGENRLQPLNVETFSQEFSSARSRDGLRMLVLDYSGTLVDTSAVDVYLKTGGKARAWHYDANEDKAVESRNNGGCLETRDPVSRPVLDALIRLAKNDARNRLVVVSQDLRQELLHALKEVPNVILVAEEGYVTYLNGEWRRLIPSSKEEETATREPWQLAVKKIIDVYVRRTDGSFAFTAPSSVSFNYMLCDPELGDHQARSLYLQLEELIHNQPLVLQHGKGNLTVRREEVNRGAALTEILHLLPAKCEFLACFGDDVEDETLFEACLLSKATKIFTCRVGVKGAQEGTKASFVLHDASEVGELLAKLSEDDDNDNNNNDHDFVRPPEMGLQDSSRKLNSMLMLPGGFITKQSLVNLSALVDEEEESNKPPSFQIKMMRGSENTTMDTIPELEAEQDDFASMPPLPMEIPETVSTMSSPILKKRTPSEAMMPNMIPALPPLEQPPRSAVVVSAQVPPIPQGAENSETTKLILAAIGGSLLTSLVFLAFGSKRRL